MESESGNANLIPIGQSARLGNAPAIQISAIGAAQVNQPELALALAVDERVLARHLGVGKNDLTHWGTAQKTTSTNEGTLASR